MKLTLGDLSVPLSGWPVLDCHQLRFDQLAIKRAGLQQVVVRTGSGDPAVVEDDHSIDIDDR